MTNHIVIVLTARASLARVQTVIEELEARNAHLSIVLAGSAALTRFGNVEHDIAAFAEFVPIYRCAGIEPHGLNGAAAYTGQLIQELTTVFDFLEPDRVVAVADRYETLAVSIAASYNQIPLTHILGGERSGNIDDKVRFANSALADVHCTPTAEAYRTLYHAGHKNVHLTGCPSVDLALRAQMPSRYALNETGIGPEFDPASPYVVALYHPCPDDEFTPRELFDAVCRSAGNLQVLWFWPNIDPGAEGIEKELRFEHEHNAPVRFYRHLPAEQFLGLIRNAACLVGNSSVGVREAGILGTPVVNVGARQHGRLTTNNVISPAFENLASIMQRQIAHGRYPLDYTYGRGNAGQAIAEVLLAQDS